MFFLLSLIIEEAYFELISKQPSDHHCLKFDSFCHFGNFGNFFVSQFELNIKLKMNKDAKNCFKKSLKKLFEIIFFAIL